jgi:indolepyruvate ferredoxin oxidoreductase beta subunit
VLALDAFGAAMEAGELRAANLVMVGALSRVLPVKEKCFLDAISKKVPARYLAANRKAFRKGRDLNPAG